MGRGELAGLRVQLVADAGAALLALLVATALSVYKPRGMTRYGRRRQHAQGGIGGVGRGSVVSAAGWVKALGITAVIAVLLFVVLHLLGGH